MGVSRPLFPMARFREAYDVEQVDLAVDHILENLALPRPRIDAGDITAMRFTPGRGGYDMTAVDDWLDEVVAELEARGAGVASATADPVEPPPAPERAYAPTTSTAVTEVRSGGSGRTLLVLAVVVVLALAAYSLFG